MKIKQRCLQNLQLSKFLCYFYDVSYYNESGRLYSIQYIFFNKVNEYIKKKVGARKTHFDFKKSG